jgi:hypothetical protein
MRAFLIAKSRQRPTIELFGMRTPESPRQNPRKLPFSGDSLWRPKNKSTACQTWQCALISMSRQACYLLPPATVNLPDLPILHLTDEDNPSDEISRIEAELEELAEVSERCRKIILVSKAAIAGGVALLFVMMLGLFGSNQAAAIGSIAVVLGGIVSLGSNLSTLQQTMAAMSTAETVRSDLISRIDLRVVGDRKV